MSFKGIGRFREKTFYFARVVFKVYDKQRTHTYFHAMRNLLPVSSFYIRVTYVRRTK